MTHYVAYVFRSPFKIDEVKKRLDAIGFGPWAKRDSEKLGEYLSNRVLKDSLLKLYEDIGGYKLDVKFRSVEDEAEWPGLQATLTAKLLPALNASNITEAEVED